MAEDTSTTGNELQFERVVTDQPPATNGAPAVVCAGCQTRLEAEYYEINGRPFCGDCREKIEAVAETPRGLMPLAIAAIFGLGAALAGAAIYYAVIAITDFEIGLVAILIGYMVGYAVRRGAGGRGGLRYQILAAVLTYTAVGLAYTPLVVKASMENDRAADQASAGTAASPSSELAPARLKAAPNLPLVLISMAGLIVALPVLVVIGSMPSGVITALIIFFGIRQAMRMTAAPVLQISGPFRIGTSPSAPTTFRTASIPRRRSALSCRSCSRG